MMRVGLCGFTMAIHEYFETFRVVEVQQTFYEPPTLTTLARWREEAGRSFEFTLKAWQLVTHRATSSTYRRLRTPLSARELADAGGFRATDTVQRGWEATLTCARALRATAILFQCPASFRPEPDNVTAMRAFFAQVERPKGVRLLWEPRGPAWGEDVVREICTELDLTHVVDPFVNTTTTPELTYFRLHGLGDHRHSYTDAELDEIRARIDPRANTAYVMFNEIPRVTDARRFVARARARARDEAPGGRRR